MLMELSELFHALGDPTRLEIVRRLASGEPHTLSSVSRKLSITRQGARKHLQVLVDARVISLQPKGRDTHVVLLKDTLYLGKTFLEKIEKQWDMRLQALKNFVEKE